MARRSFVGRRHGLYLMIPQRRHGCTSTPQFLIQGLLARLQLVIQNDLAGLAEQTFQPSIVLLQGFITETKLVAFGLHGRNAVVGNHFALALLLFRADLYDGIVLHEWWCDIHRPR